MVVLLERLPELRVGVGRAVARHQVAIVRKLHAVVLDRSARLISIVFLAAHFGGVNHVSDERQVRRRLVLLENLPCVYLLQKCSLPCGRGKRHADRLLLRALAES